MNAGTTLDAAQGTEPMEGSEGIGRPGGSSQARDDLAASPAEIRGATGAPETAAAPPAATVPATTPGWLIVGYGLAFALAALLPVVAAMVSRPALLAYILLLAYVVHQVEEHLGDRFRSYVNDHVGGGRPILTRGHVLVINVVGVWCVLVAALYLTELWAAGFLALSLHLVTVNAAVHMAMTAATRAYNPGVVTAALLLLPAAGVAWRVLDRSVADPLPWHLAGLGLSLAIHGLIVAHIAARRRRLAAEARG